MLTRGVFFRRAEKDLAPFRDAVGVLVAVSGGPDSMALLRLALHWAATSGRPRVIAATVDHGLRAESFSEAIQVRDWCAMVGVPHTILQWEGEKPTARLQERARDARYALLAAHARRETCDTIFTAHHADDQAETVLFRLMRGSGIAGLAGMVEESDRDGLRHGRPLLGWRKDDLISVCAELGQGFFSDPSNRDPRFARSRIREALTRLEPLGLDAASLVRLAGRARRANAALDSVAAAAAKRLRRDTRPDVTHLDASALAAEPEEIVLRVLATEIARHAPVAAPLRLERLERLGARFVETCRRGEPFSATLAGVMVSAKPRGALIIKPAPSRRPHQGN